MEGIYLDWASTSIPDEEIVKEISEFSIKYPGNPSSPHSLGKKSKKKLDVIRKECSKLLKTKPEQLIFTSGGTEANNLLLTSFFTKKRKGNVIISNIEHASVYELGKKFKEHGFDVIYISPNKKGQILYKDLDNKINKETVLIAIMHVNNETGAIQDLKGLYDVIKNKENTHNRNIHFHVDCVQSLGKIPLELNYVDSASFSAHKIKGPRGVGALYISKELKPLYTGGGQEFKQRPGTENLPGIWGFFLAIKKALSNLENNFKVVDKKMNQILNIIKQNKHCFIIGERKDSDPCFSPYILNLSFPQIPGEVLVRVMGDLNFYIATGSACSTHKKNKTRVIDSMYEDKKIGFSSIRISIDPKTSDEEIKKFLYHLDDQVNSLMSVIA
jgi:cysteine desulfurase